MGLDLLAVVGLPTKTKHTAMDDSDPFSTRFMGQQWGLRVAALEDDQALQEAVLSVHHACMLTFSATPAVKLIENDRGVAFIKVLQSVVVPGQRASGGDADQVPAEEEQSGG